MDDKVLTKFKKNAIEEVRISVRYYKGQTLLDFRAWVENQAGQFVPTKKGLCLSLAQYGRLIAAFKEVDKELLKELRKVNQVVPGSISISSSSSNAAVLV